MEAQSIVALTFDDGPNPEITLPLLEICAEYEIPASFFVVGERISRETAGTVKKAFLQGCEICNHSFSHPDMSKLSGEEIAEQVQKTSELVREITGSLPRFFRPPYIAVSEEMFRLIHMPFIAGFGAEDYNPAVSAKERVRRILSQVRDGAVILLHDAAGNTQTVDAVRELIPALLARGYRFVTVSELFAEKGITPQTHIIYSYAEQTSMYAENTG
ncbi:MAG: polysaccharide deacetylase family protein [Oscillospiraceae bacterium]|nr:polysaccharide deacetylase family protein [Oscillospiraceae bacterium]